MRPLLEVYSTQGWRRDDLKGVRCPPPPAIREEGHRVFLSAFQLKPSYVVRVVGATMRHDTVREEREESDGAVLRLEIGE